MNNPTWDFTFAQLRETNVARCIEDFHPLDAWSSQLWGLAVAGEVGELCNLLKKQIRGDDVPQENIEDEIADAVIYLDLLAARLGVSLDGIVRRKFNKTSRKIGSDHFLPE